MSLPERTWYGLSRSVAGRGPSFAANGWAALLIGGELARAALDRHYGAVYIADRYGAV